LDPITAENLVEFVPPGGQPSKEKQTEVTYSAPPGHQFICQDCAGLGWVPATETEH
jgi:hypothetical protein